MEEHEKELSCLEIHQKEHEKKVKNEKGNDKVEERNPIALKTSISKSSQNKQSHCETKDEKYYDEEDMSLFIKKFNRYIWKHGDKYSEKNKTKSKRLFNSLEEDENKKSKPRSSYYNYGKVGHYRPEFPMKKKGHHKKSRKSRRAHVAWERESDSSSDESSSSSVESTRICLMVNKKKKKVVSHSKFESTYDLSYSQWQESFENIQRQVIYAFKKLASNKRIFSHLEAKILENEKNMEALMQSMVDILKDKSEADKPS